MRLPRTLFWRTFLWLATLVLSTTLAWLTLFRHIDAEPRAREIAQLATSAVNLIRAALLAAAPDKRIALFNELSSREGIRLLPAEREDRIQPMPDNRFMRLLQQELNARLGPHTRMAAEVDGVPGFWVSFRLEQQDDEEFWLILPRERTARQIAGHWLAWGFLALTLALGMAWLIASGLSRPLKTLAQSAARLGRGDSPAPIPETGAEELRHLTAAFNTLVHDLKQWEDERSLVLAGISHDLRTPLTRLHLEAEMSISDNQAREGVIADLEQMEGIIAQFMDYARGEQESATVDVDLWPFLQQIADRQTARQRALHLTVTALPPCPVRPRALQRALDNLIDNAWKYGARNVWLRADVDQNTLMLHVDDDGPGIPASERERLKRPFTRLEQARSNASGTGLGLAIVDRIARLHGGALQLGDREGGGLAACLVLPLGGG